MACYAAGARGTALGSALPGDVRGAERGNESLHFGPTTGALDQLIKVALFGAVRHDEVANSAARLVEPVLPLGEVAVEPELDLVRVVLILDRHREALLHVPLTSSQFC